METPPDWDLLAVVRSCCSTTATTTTSTAPPTISTADLIPSPPQLIPFSQPQILTQEPCFIPTTRSVFFEFSNNHHELQDVCRPLTCTTTSSTTAAVPAAVSTTASSLAPSVSSPSSVIIGRNFCVGEQHQQQQQTRFQQQQPNMSRQMQFQQQQQPSISQQMEFQQQPSNISQQQMLFQQQPNISQQMQFQQQRPSISQQMQFQKQQQPSISQQTQFQLQQPSISQQKLFQQQPNISQQSQYQGLIKPSHVIFGAPSTSMDGGGTSNVQRTKKRKNLMKKVCHVPAEGLSSDMWAWRKYGQKPIKGSPYPRGYYRCSSSKGCLARKQVERNRSDPKMFIVTYTAEHNHPMPTHRNSLAGSTRQKPLSSTGTPPQEQPSCSSPSPASLSPLTEKSESKTDGDDLIKEEDDATDMALSDLMLNDDFYVGFEQIDGGSDGSDCFSDQFSPSSEFPWLAESSSSATTAAGGS